ncbi:hypothetical protein FPK51_29040, partial [Acinetobacter baumannii]|nr:hypothetical protein [Acinetobacter baumannii]
AAARPGPGAACPPGWRLCHRPVHARRDGRWHRLLRVGRSIGVNANGEKVGLLGDKPVYIGIASGGVFSGEQARQPDFLTPYL